MVGGGIIPFVGGCSTGSAAVSAGDCVDAVSLLTTFARGDPDRALLGGLTASPVGCEPGRASPFVNGCLLCTPFVADWTSCFCRASASSSTVTPRGAGAGAGEVRFWDWDRLSITFGFGPPIFNRGPAGSSTFSRASDKRALKCS